MRVYRNEINSSWLKAAAIGSIWGSTEVMLGSFLHNLRMPLAGSALTFIAIIYMTVFAYIWREKFIILKASLITALIKSISPSSVLLGPMTAIILEGIIFELAIALLGRNFLGFAAGGILTQMSVIFHKVVTLLIVYGSDLVRIANNLYTFMERQLRFSFPEQLAAIYLLTAYALIGLTASLIGYMAASHTKKFLDQKRENPQLSYFLKPVKINVDPFRVNPARRSPFLMLLINVVLMIFLLWLINQISIISSLIIIGLVFASYYYFYPQAFRIFKKLFFWVQIIVLFIAGVAFYYDSPSKLMFNTQGFELSGLMILRALIIIVFFSVISIQLNNERIKAYLLRRGFHNVYLTLELSFLTLPRFLEYFSQKFNLRIIRELLLFSFSLVDFYQNSMGHRSVYIIEGGINAGKTTFTKKVIKLLSQYEISIGGVFTEKKRTSDILEYLVTDIKTGQQVLLCTENKIKDPYFKTMRFYFNKQGVDYGIEFIKKAIESKVIVIDEVGKLELLNYGWSRIIEILLDLKKKQLWTVRKKYTRPVLQKFMINQAFIFDIEQDTPENVAKFILDKILFSDETHIT